MTIRLGFAGKPLASLWNRDNNPAGMMITDGEQTNNARICNSLHFTDGGVLISFVELHNGVGDELGFCFGVKLSYDNGDTWTPVIEVEDRSPISTSRLAMGTVNTHADGTAVLVYTYWDDWNGSSGTPQQFERTSSYPYTTWSSATEITSSVKKVDNSNPASLPAHLKSTNSAWLTLLPISSVRDSSNNILVGCVYRYVDGVSHFCVLKRTSAGTWTIHGGLDESNATNNGANESGMCLTSTGILAVFRHKDVDEYHQSTSTDGGVTWSTLATTGIAATETQPALCSNPANRDEVYLAGVHDAIRACGKIFKSTNAGTSWDSGTIIFDRYCSYPGLVALSATELFGVWENTANYTDYAVEYQQITPFKLNVSDLGQAPNPIHLLFNEKSSGAMVAGHTVLDYGGGGVMARGQTAWTYNARGVVCNGTNGLVLDPARTSSTKRTAYACRTGDSFTFEIILDGTGISAGGATQQIAGDRSSAAGWGLTVVASTGIVTLTLSDSSNAPTATHTTDIRTGVHKIGVTRDVANDRIYVTIDDVMGTPATDTTTGAITNGNAAVLGSQPNGTTNPLASGVEIHQSRFWRKVVSTAESLSTSYTKPTPAAYCGGRALPAFAPTVLYPSSCKLWIHGTSDGGMQASGDSFGALQPVVPFQEGRSVSSYRDPALGTLFIQSANSRNRNIVIKDDAAVGPLYYLPRKGSGASSWWTGGSTANFNFVHDDGIFTIYLGAFRIERDISTLNVLMSNNNGTTTAYGFEVLWNTNGTMRWQVTNAAVGVPRVEYTTTKVFTRGTLWGAAFVGNGPGVPCNMHWWAWPGGKALPTSITTENSSNMAGSNGTNNATAALAIGGRADDSRYSDWSSKDIAIFNDNFSSAEIQAMWKNAVYAGANYQRGPIRIGLGPGL